MSFKALSDAVVGLTASVFGEDVTYTPNGEPSVSIKGVFDNAWVEVEGITSLKPILRISLTDLSVSPARNDLLTVNDTDYRVSEARLDGYGGATLILNKV